MPALHHPPLSEALSETAFDIENGHLLAGVMPTAVLTTFGLAAISGDHPWICAGLTLFYSGVNAALSAYLRRMKALKTALPAWFAASRSGLSIIVCPLLYLLAGARTNAWYVAVAPVLALTLFDQRHGAWRSCALAAGMTLAALAMRVPLGTVAGLGLGFFTMIFVYIPVIRSLRERTLTAHRASKAAERASAAKAEFLATMSHEVRTPLNGMLGMIHLLSEQRLSEEQRGYLHHLRTSGDLLLSIVNDILDLSKIEAGKLALDAQPFAPSSWLQRCLTAVRPVAEAKGLSLLCEEDGSLPEQLLGDERRLEQVLLNLLSNAVKFTERGTVCVSVSYRDAKLCFTVADTGIGMSEPEIARLFQPFEQADVSTSRRFGGTGLGLAICGRLLAMMDGNIRIESRPHQGTRFLVEVPTKLGPKLVVDDRPLSTSSSRLVGHVIVAEDNKVNQLVTQKLLEKHGLTVTLAENGHVAVSEFRLRQPDLVLMDCQMPSLDGFGATAAIRLLEKELGRNPRVPVIALTAETGDEVRRLCEAAGMDDYLSKPILRDALERALRRWLPSAPDSNPARASA